MKKAVDILFLGGDGIGNVIQLLYAVEYCIKNGKKTGLFLYKTAPSFANYLRDSYGDVVLDSLEGVIATNLVHSWLFADAIPAAFSSYFYVSPNFQNTLHLSETEQYLSIVRSLYPSSFNSTTLAGLKEHYSERLRVLEVENKYIIYPGCDSRAPTKRWPYFKELVRRLGKENVILIGGRDDLNFDCSYYYPKWIAAFFPAFFLRKIYVYNAFKRLGLLSPHAHIDDIEREAHSYFDVFTWAELAALLKRSKYFIGNDGGLTHLAGACGATGLMIFGPTSINKNRPYNDRLIPISQALDCQPCQFTVNRIDTMSKKSILCPYQVRCLYSIHAEQIVNAMQGNVDGGSPAVLASSGLGSRAAWREHSFASGATRIACGRSPRANMNGLNLVAYSLRRITRVIGKKWGCRALARVPKGLTEFKTIISYRGARFSVDTAEYAGRSMFYFDEYEPAQEAAFLKLTAKRTVFDIGANVGIFTLLAALGGAHRVFAFEPSRLIRAALQKNLALNSFAGQVSVIPDAVSNSEGMMPFYETRSGNWGVGRIFPFGEASRASPDYDVHADTIDSLVRRLGMPDVIKIDIEGAEWLALGGASLTLSATNAPQLFIEFHPQEIMALGGTIEACLKKLQEFGYRQYEIVGTDPGTHAWFCFSKVELIDSSSFRLCSRNGHERSQSAPDALVDRSSAKLY